MSEPMGGGAMRSSAMHDRTGRRRKGAGAAAAVVALVVAALTAGCGSGGGGKSSSAKGEEAAATSQPFARLDPAAFAARTGDKGAVLINVHVPYEGELPHTDAFIPFDHILGDAHLPKDKHTEVLLYCRTGRMSEIAANALHGAGYTRLAHLEGGMRAWEASGHPLLQNPAHASPTMAPHPM
jgi:rhodanese-related sulfurtransferase